MNFGDTWPHGQQPGGPAVTLPPHRPRQQRLLVWEVRKLQQQIADILDAAQSTDDAA
jgi:hypothetical protein